MFLIFSENTRQSQTSHWKFRCPNFSEREISDCMRPFWPEKNSFFCENISILTHWVIKLWTKCCPQSCVSSKTCVVKVALSSKSYCHQNRVSSMSHSLVCTSLFLLVATISRIEAPIKRGLINLTHTQPPTVPPSLIIHKKYQDTFLWHNPLKRKF